MSKTKKDLLRKGGLFVPLIFSFGAKIEDLPLDVFLDDPTKISNSLRTINSFLNVDGIVCSGNDRMLADALRSLISQEEGTLMDPDEKASVSELDAAIPKLVNEGRPAVILEVAKRLGILLPDTPVLAVVASPLKLASQLTGLEPQALLLSPDLLGATTKAVLTFLRALGETGIDMVSIQEDNMPPLAPKHQSMLNRCYSPLWNTAKFYGMQALFMPENMLPENVLMYKKIIDRIVFPTGTSTELIEKFKKPSFSVPSVLLEKDADEIESFLLNSDIAAALQSKKLFLVTTEQEVPGDIDKERMIQGIQKIKEVFAQLGK
jgi:hypothetical protein